MEAGKRQVHVHSIEAGDQCRRHQQQGDQRKNLHDLVLLEIDKTDYGILQILKPLEAEVGMVDKGRNILEYNVQMLANFRILGTALALDDIGEQPLLIHDILADEHCIFLQLIDIQQEFLVDILLLIDTLAELRHVFGDKLHDICIQVDTLVHDLHEYGEAVGELVRLRLNLALEGVEGTEGYFPEGCNGLVRKYE